MLNLNETLTVDMGELAYIYNIPVVTEKGELYIIRLKETEENSKMMRKTIFGSYKRADSVKVEITANHKYALITNERDKKVYTGSIMRIEKASKARVDIRNRRIKQEAEDKKIRDFFNKLDIRFKVEEHFDDDADITIWHKGKEIFYGKARVLDRDRDPE